MTSLEIEAFLAACRNESISKAAAELYISQSSLSTRLRTLERELGCTLMVRSKGSRTLTLTPEGRRFLELARQHRDIEDQMRALARSTPAQRLRVSSLSSIGSYLLPPVYQQFALRWPDIQLEIQDLNTRDACRLIERGELDLTFSAMWIHSEEISAIPFLSEPMCFVCAAGAPYPDPVSLAELSPENEVYSSWSAELDLWHQTVLGSIKTSRVHLELMSQLPLFVSRPNAWAITPLSVSRVLTADGNIETRALAFPVPERVTCILCSRKALSTEPVQAFLSCLKETLAEQQLPGLQL